MDNFNKEQISYCKYCGKQCKSLNSLKQHEIRCKENPNHIITKLNQERYNIFRVVYELVLLLII